MSKALHPSSNQKSCSSPATEANSTHDIEHVKEEENLLEKKTRKQTTKVWDEFKQISTKEGGGKSKVYTL